LIRAKAQVTVFTATVRLNMFFYVRLL